MGIFSFLVRVIVKLYAALKKFLILLNSNTKVKSLGLRKGIYIEILVKLIAAQAVTVKAQVDGLPVEVTASLDSLESCSLLTSLLLFSPLSS